MNMLRFCSCIGAFFLLMQSLCFAHPSISDDQAVLGWVTIFDTKEKVEGIYGKPKNIVEMHNGHCKVDVYRYNYGDHFTVDFNKSTNRVCYVATSKPNGIKLPNGITVGSSMYEVERKLGPRFDKIFAHYKPYPLNNRADVTLSFIFDNNGKVKFIHLAHSKP